MLRLAALTSLLPALAAADPGILLFPALGRPEQVTVSGRVLKDAPKRGSTPLSRNLRGLLASNWEGAPVEIALGGQTAKVVSGHDGQFEATFSAPKDHPFEPGIHTVEARVPGAVAKSAVEIVSPEAPFVVISDFDDTLAVTNVTDKKKMIETALLKDAQSQPVIEGMPAFYRCLRQGKPAPPGFALVSGSPVQFLPRIAAFAARHDFPFFGMYLRDLGPNTLSGYKQPIIRSLMKQLPHPVVLVGDSGEHDPEVYREIRGEFPDRVKRIYIRDAGKSADVKRFEGMVLFKDPKVAAEDAVKHGLADAKCVGEWK